MSVSLEFSTYKSMSSANVILLFSSSLDDFSSLFCLGALSQTPGAVLSRSGGDGHPGLAPDLNGKALSLPPSVM